MYNVLWCEIRFGQIDGADSIRVVDICLSRSFCSYCDWPLLTAHFLQMVPQNSTVILRLSRSCILYFFNSVIRSVVVGAFQIAFRAEIHVNDVFSFFKNYFWHQHIKTIQKVQTALNFSKKKKFKIWWNAVTKAMPNGALSFFIFKYIKKIFLILLY